MAMFVSPARCRAVYASAPNPSDIPTALIAAAHSLLGEAMTAAFRASDGRRALWIGKSDKRIEDATESGGGGMIQRLKARGLASEIIAWTLRLFVPTGANAAVILAAVMERYLLVRIADRAAA
jgi:hypothetical protein